MSWLPLILLGLAAIFKAVADTLQHHFDTSVFKNKDVRWWNPAFSWKYVGFIPFSSYRPDAWHLSNTLMIACFISFGLFYDSHYKWWIELIAGGIGFVIVFNLFYNKILK